LRSILEGILLEPMFDLPGLEGVEEIVINREVVDVGGSAKPLYIYSERREDVGSSA
jgi:ATP-dependent Clp protease ATP-binding subunit ClpX